MKTTDHKKIIFGIIYFMVICIIAVIFAPAILLIIIFLKMLKVEMSYRLVLFVLGALGMKHLYYEYFNDKDESGNTIEVKDCN